MKELYLTTADWRSVLMYFSDFLETYLLENSNRKRVKKGTLMLPFLTLSNPFYEKRVPLGLGLSHKGCAFSKKEKKKGSPRTPLKNKIKKYISLSARAGRDRKSREFGNFEHETKNFSFFFDFPLYFSKKRAIISVEGLKSLKNAAAKAADTILDRSMLGRLGRGNPGASFFAISTQPSFFRALKCAGKGYQNPQRTEVATW